MNRARFNDGILAKFRREKPLAYQLPVFRGLPYANRVGRRCKEERHPSCNLIVVEATTTIFVFWEVVAVGMAGEVDEKIYKEYPWWFTHT